MEMLMVIVKIALIMPSFKYFDILVYGKRG